MSGTLFRVLRASEGSRACGRPGRRPRRLAFGCTESDSALLGSVCRVACVPDGSSLLSSYVPWETPFMLSDASWDSFASRFALAASIGKVAQVRSREKRDVTKGG